MPEKFFYRHGFTLTELLIVISIISVLTIASLMTFARISARARDTRRVADMQQIRTALELFRRENGHYPDPCDNPPVPIQGQIIGAGLAIDQHLARYLSTVPRDPLHNPSPVNSPSTDQYYYVYDMRHQMSYSINCSKNPEHPVPLYNPSPTCNCSDDANFDLVVVGFNKGESNNIPLQKATCSGTNLNINKGRYSVLLYKHPYDPVSCFPR